MPATGFDIRNPEDLAHVAHELADVNRKLGREETAPEWVLGFVKDLCGDIADTSQEEWAAVIPDQWIALQQTALQAQRVIFDEDDEHRQRRRLRSLLEEFRFRFSRLAE